MRNSPANQVPSHGTTLFATAHAIDFIPVDDNGKSAPFDWEALVRPQSARPFPGFGRPILSPVAGTICAAHDLEPDHAAYRGLPSIGYVLTQHRRATTGWAGLAGNHVVISHGDALVALCHLQQGSLQVRCGQRVDVGEMLARCGNSGNSTEPHLHLQAYDRAEIEYAQPIPLSFEGKVPKNGEIVRVSST